MDWREILMIRMLRIVRILRIDRVLPVNRKSYRFADYFRGFERVRAVRRIFGERTEEVLRDLRVEFTWIRGYMWTNGVNGHIMVSSHYLNNGDRVDIYLDIIHELTHVKQFMDGKVLFDEYYSYVERPTEIEAYRNAVEEARRLGLSEKRICEYLKTEWMTDEELERLAKTLSVDCSRR